MNKARRRDHPRNIGRRLAAIRERRKLTVQAVADRLAVSHAAVSRWEHGAARPSDTHIAQLARALNVDPGFLARGAEDGNELAFIDALTPDRGDGTVMSALEAADFTARERREAEEKQSAHMLSLIEADARLRRSNEARAVAMRRWHVEAAERRAAFLASIPAGVPASVAEYFQGRGVAPGTCGFCGRSTSHFRYVCTDCRSNGDR